MRPFPGFVVASALLLSTALAHAEVPPGYHIEERPRTGLARTGGVVTALGVSMLAYGVYDLSNEKNAASVYMIGGGVLTAIGAPLLIVGLTTKKSYLVPNSVAVAPVAAPSFGGLSVAATF